MRAMYSVSVEFLLWVTSPTAKWFVFALLSKYSWIRENRYIDKRYKDKEKIKRYQIKDILQFLTTRFPDSKVHGANMEPTWALSAPNGPHVGPMNLAIRVIVTKIFTIDSLHPIASMGPSSLPCSTLLDVRQCTLICFIELCYDESRAMIQCKDSSKSHTKYQNLNVSCLVLQLPLLNPPKPGVKSKMKM